MLAIIPARGGSKGLPGKNIKRLCGMPLICYSIRAALKSNLIDKVIISTEDKEIASIAENCGAEVPFIRPKNLATDTAMAIDTYLHAVDYISKESSKQIESFVVLLPTSPLRITKDIDESINSLLTSNIISPSCNLISSLSTLLTKTPVESILSKTVIPKDLIIFSSDTFSFFCELFLT